ncbi:hypothetical protein [Microbacterium sp. ProA8]|uniref:hypothetical protein n=1 Tax=Microbacterium chionoecetis TaxID=3153754 RepID=UPI003265A532
MDRTLTDFAVRVRFEFTQAGERRRILVYVGVRSVRTGAKSVKLLEARIGWR